MNDEEFSEMRGAAILGLRRTPLHEVYYDAAESASKPKTKNKKVKEKKGKGGEVRESRPSPGVIDSPAGAIPAPAGDGAKMWELPPEELRAQLTNALWPTDTSRHKWVPRPAMTLDQFVRDGI
ncbi:hypothetical protein [Streptomyces sp. PH10-H1]|uniref:hypothetical protein n=1 Tax=Streptomyces sp. PH10-H1 TaxID=3046212 RepID=UPI0024BA8885|nr:hypothetical protein [Streptomyces sp. PH10-H1]MDJ0341789.1 hypothetical protein [Streptomyces sp. PH10-H1]